MAKGHLPDYEHSDAPPRGSPVGRTCRAFIVASLVILSLVGGAILGLNLPGCLHANPKPDSIAAVNNSTVVQTLPSKRGELCEREDCVDIFGHQLVERGEHDESPFERRQLLVPDLDQNLDANDDGLPDQPVTWTATSQGDEASIKQLCSKHHPDIPISRCVQLMITSDVGNPTSKFTKDKRVLPEEASPALTLTPDEENCRSLHAGTGSSTVTNYGLWIMAHGFSGNPRPDCIYPGI